MEQVQRKLLAQQKKKLSEKLDGFYFSNLPYLQCVVGDEVAQWVNIYWSWGLKSNWHDLCVTLLHGQDGFTPNG